MKVKMSTGDKPCLACRAGFPNECHFAWDPAEPDSCGPVIFTPSGDVKSDDSSPANTGYIEDGFEAAKDISEYKDPVSTGRKRAAQMYPIEPGMTCEWAGLAKAGGGVTPIVGCIGRPASDRHHGPDKNTMNNAQGNLHRICDFCHNTWHALNDPEYGERPEHTKPFIPRGILGEDWFLHDAHTKATTADILAAETKRLTEK
jgi:hypothetical protein